MTRTPAPYSQAWWRDQPPERLADMRARFEAGKDQLPENERRFLEAHLPQADVAEQIDRDMERMLKHGRKR